MKRTILVLLVAAVGFSGCKKEDNLFNNEEHYSASDFVDSRALDASASRENSIGPKSNMKAIIRKVANSDNQYRLILKVDSVYTNVAEDEGGIPKIELVALKEIEKLSAGLSMPDPANPDKELIIFKEGEMQFTKQNENGFYVYRSEAFSAGDGSKEFFDYELVDVSYHIIHTIGDSYPRGHVMRSTSGSHRCFILPNGKAIEQNPGIEKVNEQGKWKHPNGQEFIKSFVITIGNDPAQDAEKLIFKPDVVKVETGDPKEPVKLLQLPSLEFEKTHFNQNTGIARFGKPDAVQAAYKGISLPKEWDGKGTFLYLRRDQETTQEIKNTKQPFYTVTVE